MLFIVKSILVAKTPQGKDPRYKRTLRFFVNKGYIDTFGDGQPINGKLDIADVLWTAKHVDPRFYWALPAALIRFPRHFKGEMPTDLKMAIECLREGRNGPPYQSYPMKSLRVALAFQPRDGRTKEPTQKIWIRVPLAQYQRLRALATSRGTTVTQLILSAFKDF